MSKLIKTKCSAKDFQTPHGATCFDLFHVKNAAEGRHATVVILIYFSLMSDIRNTT